MRKPVNELTPLETRQAVWDLVRVRKVEFTVTGIARDTRLSVGSVQDYLTGLANAGYLAYESPVRRFQPGWYRLVKDVGREAPRVRRDGTPVTQGAKTEQMWRVIWIIKQFTPRDLAVQASQPDSLIPEAYALDYCRNLAAAGYLVARDGLYRSIPGRYTGPLPPMIQRTKRVYDPNLGQIVWREEEP